MPPTKLGAGTNIGDRPYWNGTSWTSADIQHALLSAIHSDTETETPVAGDVIIANALAKWSRLAKGVNDKILTMYNDLPAWRDPVGVIHGAELHTGNIIPSADQDFGGYRLKGLKRMTSVPSAADIGTDGLVLYKGTTLGPETWYGGSGDTDTQVASNYEIAYAITIPSGTITLVRRKLAANENVKLALYDDDAAGGEPNTQLINWGTFTGTSGVNDYDVANYDVTAGTYWLGMLSDNFQDRYSTSNPYQRRYKSRAYNLGLESPWPNASDTHDGTYNFYEQLGVAQATISRRLYANVDGTVAYSTLT